MKKTLVYGIHAAEALLTSHPEYAVQLWAQSDRKDSRLQAVLQLATSVKVQYVPKSTLDRLTDSALHQGIVIEKLNEKPIGHVELTTLIEQATSPLLLLIIDGVQDPHNLGACLRTAEAAGVDAVIIPKDKAVGVTPVVRKVACGAAEVIPTYFVTNLARTMETLKQAGVWFVGAAGEAEQEYTTIDYTGNTAIVVGAEGEGMRQLTKKQCDYLVKIPMAGLVSSLNVSVATGVLLFEAVRCRKR